MDRVIKYRFYDKLVKRIYYPPTRALMAKFLAYATDDYKDLIIPMQATGIYDATKFKDLSPIEQEKWLKNHTKDQWPGYEIYEGDITALRYDKERTEYGVVYYFSGEYLKGGTALSSYQKVTKVVGNLFDGYPRQHNLQLIFIVKI